jgi:hypothetical protein
MLTRLLPPRSARDGMTPLPRLKLRGTNSTYTSVLASYRLLLSFYNSMMQAKVVRLCLMRISANISAFISKILKLSGPSNLDFMTFASIILTSFVFPRHDSPTCVMITVLFFLIDTLFKDLTGCILTKQLRLLQAQV